METWFSVIVTQVPLCVLAILFLIELYKMRKSLEKLNQTLRDYVSKKCKR